MATISLFRLIAIVLTVIILLSATRRATPTIEDLEIIIIGYSILAFVMTNLWWRFPSLRFGMQGSLWFVDVIMAELLLVNFSHPGSSAPALLPVLAYEAEVYWPSRGLVMGSLSAGLLLISTWWLRLWAHLPTFSGITLVFWLGTLGLLIAFPLIIGVLPSVPSPDQKRPEDHATKSSILSASTSISLSQTDLSGSKFSTDATQSSLTICHSDTLRVGCPLGSANTCPGPAEDTGQEGDNHILNLL
ncbi:MAG: hypothetical protein C7B47_17820 [Sulfobacillus thermosulfidooxidans]|uniref:Uncharacterized protein n=1 Tax=Sulfobacillus thermosulfidooxidans TaxID=28034 RepID=A0A2T2WEN9_SULTH|nr:MAG: hypothetical protein C7B47_17820 [Sulfobacillus thermosulfidooxidans]